MKRRLYEYKTTYGDAEPYPADPTPPDGEDWEMCGAAAMYGYHGSKLFWFWRRVESGENR